ncbi:MAG: site-specific integrase [Actinobacteria bacterium]|nr:site-specific integrase [Actinomycetota bacterium]
MAGPASRVSRVLMTGPLAPFADAYAAELGERGYTPLSIVNELRQVGRLSRWLEARGLSDVDLSGDRVEEFLVWQRAGGRHRCQWSRPGLVCLLEVLRGLGVLAAEQFVLAGSPTDLLLASFERYLLVERGLAAGTVCGYVAHARRFLDGLAPGGLAGLSAGEVTGAVLREAGSGVSVSATQNYVFGLRAFLRFCFVEGLLDADLSQAALSMAGRRRSSLPKRITGADAAALLGACDRRSSLGRRDYALIILLLRLGLRRGEVAGLTLDDIDWRAGELLVRGKGGREDRLPLPTDVGAAIAAYLQRGRLTSTGREVFLRARAPYRPIASGTVSSTVRRVCRRAGIPEVGAHRLRHTTACEMVKAHVALERIGQVLRHRSLQSTAIYARVDLDQLRLLAAPWPQGGAGR